jgi:23S rRNA (cytidine1920-2'-O)/16S rRNA (cytidine1409-2'-O)-methyltransferase
MRLDQALVARGLCESRTEAQLLVQGEAVLVNGVVCQKQTRNILEEDILEVTKRRPYVSRGGDKLEGAFLDVFGEGELAGRIKGSVVLDIGSSTGGFTDYLIQHGAVDVDAVDVGTQQLHHSLRNSPTIHLYENTDIRKFKSNKKYDLIVADLSFVSLSEMLPVVVSFATRSVTDFFLLIKPQFEVGKGNTKKGIVRDDALVQEVLRMVEEKAGEAGVRNTKTFPCRIRGGDGNQEYFLYGTF